MADVETPPRDDYRMVLHHDVESVAQHRLEKIHTSRQPHDQWQKENPKNPNQTNPVAKEPQDIEENHLLPPLGNVEALLLMKGNRDLEKHLVLNIEQE